MSRGSLFPLEEEPGASPGSPQQIEVRKDHVLVIFPLSAQYHAWHAVGISNFTLNE